jgi:hypothetical protein
LKKRSKKLLSLWCVPPAIDWAPMDKSFLLLFFKKEALPSLSGIIIAGLMPNIPSTAKVPARWPKR